MVEITIRRAIETDLNQMARLYETSFSEHILVHRGILNNPEYLARHIENQDESWIVAEDVEKKIVGIAALACAPPVGLGEIERVCVSKEFRGNGISLSMCRLLIDDARKRDLGFVEAFARGDEPAMQRTFQKLGFIVYGISPRFEVIHGSRTVREQFVHMGLELKPETIDIKSMDLIPSAANLFAQIYLPK